MAKRSKIRYSDKDDTALTRNIRLFNRKIKRVLEKTSEAYQKFIPEKVSKEELLKNIETRADFNRVMHSLERFRKRGSEEIREVETADGSIITSEYLYNEATIARRTINRRRKEAKEKINIVQALAEGNLMLQLDEIQTRPIKPISETHNVDLKNFIKSMNFMSSDAYIKQMNEYYKENYLTGIFKQFGPIAMTEIEELIHDIDATDFFNLASNNLFTSIPFIYEPQEADLVYESIKEVWQEINETGSFNSDRLEAMYGYSNN